MRIMWSRRILSLSACTRRPLPVSSESVQLSSGFFFDAQDTKMKVLVALFVLICLWQKATGTLTAAADVSPAAGALYVANRYIPVLYIPQLVTASSLTAETASASATTMNVMGSTTAITVPTKMAALVRTLPLLPF